MRADERACKEGERRGEGGIYVDDADVGVGLLGCFDEEWKEGEGE